MKAYRIAVNAIDTIYEGNSEQEALDNYARDAGYSSYADLQEQHPDEVQVDEIPSPRSAADALDLDDEQWELFVRREAGIINVDEMDDNGMHMHDILAKKRQDALQYLGWY